MAAGKPLRTQGFVLRQRHDEKWNTHFRDPSLKPAILHIIRAMPIAAGSRLGPYEIIAPAGAGGMGEVFKARDTRLNRTVAIKILTEQWTHDAAMQERFEREAKTIAALNHPNVCTLHDIGHEDGINGEAAVDFLVMEYLEGETLAERLSRGAIPLAEALTIAMAIADALDKAHKQGVVHRDLKPANVMLTKRGPKLLDFGLAKATAMDALGIPAGSMLPTAASVTMPGTILGTVQYMAPEQLEGKDADARTDIFAFGVILYEMVSGKKPFQGKSKTLLMSAILTAHPQPLAHAQPMSPASLDHLVRRCLAKDPEERWQYVHDLLIQLRWIAGRSTTTGKTIETAAQRARRLAGNAAIVLAGLLAFPAAMYVWRATPEEFQFRSPVVGISPQDIAVSPDGRMIAYVASAPAPRALYVRPVRSIDSRKIAGTDEAAQPFWSPDSRSIGFVAGGRLKTVDVEGGAPKDVGPAPEFSGGAWNAAGTILFGTAKGIMRVSAEGGTPTQATTIEKGESGHFWPEFMPGGDRFAYLAWTQQPGKRAVFSTALGSKERAKVMDGESNVVYARSGYLLFHRDASVFAQAVDADGIPTSAQPMHIADGVLFTSASGRGAFASSQTGTLLYFQGAADAQAQGGRGGTVVNTQLGWVGRTNELIATAGDVATYGDFDVSPDGRLVAVTRLDQGTSGSDIWVIDWQRAGVATPITRDPSDDLRPVWSHDSRRIAYMSYRKGNSDIYVRNSNGTGPETPLVETPADESVGGWSGDGRYLLYVSNAGSSDDIYALPLTAEGTPDGKPLVIVSGPGQKSGPQLSFDGKWLAYVTTESGTAQVMITSFPDGRERIPISKDGGGQPRWRRDGRELYYRLPSDNTVMVVKITPGPVLTAGVPQPLFRPIVNAVSTRDPFRQQLSVDATGDRFLIRVPPQATAGVPGGAWPGLVAYSSTAGNALPAQVLAGGPGRGLGQRSRGAGPGFAQYNGLTVVLDWQQRVEK
jgi:Tol biopolymer transport system component